MLTPVNGVAEIKPKIFSNQMIAMEKIDLLSSQGCMMAGQEVIDTIASVKNLVVKTKLLMLRLDTH